MLVWPIFKQLFHFRISQISKLPSPCHSACWFSLISWGGVRTKLWAWKIDGGLQSCILVPSERLGRKGHTALTLWYSLPWGGNEVARGILCICSLPFTDSARSTVGMWALLKNEPLSQHLSMLAQLLLCFLKSLRAGNPGDSVPPGDSGSYWQHKTCASSRHTNRSMERSGEHEAAPPAEEFLQLIAAGRQRIQLP